MGNSDKYLNYREEDFTSEPFFRSWVFAPNEESDSFWYHWLDENPDKKNVVENARWRMLGLKIEEDLKPDERLDLIWKNIQQVKANQPEGSEGGSLHDMGQSKVIPIFSFSGWRQWAAVFLLFSFSAVLFYLYKTNRPVVSQTVTTTFGQTKIIILPDQSKVVLNGNSRLVYAQKWNEKEDRMVALEGEAFFTVKPTQNHQKFLVKLKDGLEIKVLGTRFTVTQRPTKTQVVLSEGKVQLTQKPKKDKSGQTANQYEAIMQPGDLIEVEPNNTVFTKSRVAHPELFAAFAQDKIVFKNTPISEVARVLEDTYGYKINFEKPGLASKLFNGTTPTNDIKMLFAAIEKLFGVQVLQNGKNITIQ